MPTGTDDTPVAGSPIRTVASTDTVAKRRQFIKEVFQRSEKLQAIEDRHLNALSDDEINALYGICTKGMGPNETIHDFILEDIANRVEEIKEAGQIITHLEEGNPLTQPFREFITAAKRIDQTKDAAVRLGTTLEALGALTEGLGKVVKTAGRFIQKHPKAFTAVAAALGVAIPVLWPASASVVAGVGIGIAVIEAIGFGIQKWKQRKAKRAKQAQEALENIAEANPELAAQVTANIEQEARAERDATRSTPHERNTKAEQVSELLGSSAYTPQNVTDALGAIALEKIDINMIKAQTRNGKSTENKNAIKLICDCAKEMPKTKAQAEVAAEAFIKRMIEDFDQADLTAEPSFKEANLNGFKLDLKEALKPKLIEALTPSTPPRTTLEKIMKMTEACTQYQSALNTAGGVESRIATKKLQTNIVKKVISKDFGHILKAASKAPVVEHMTSRATAAQVKKLSKHLSVERSGRAL